MRKFLFILKNYKVYNISEKVYIDGLTFLFSPLFTIFYWLSGNYIALHFSNTWLSKGVIYMPLKEDICMVIFIEAIIFFIIYAALRNDIDNKNLDKIHIKLMQQYKYLSDYSNKHDKKFISKSENFLRLLKDYIRYTEFTDKNRKINKINKALAKLYSNDTKIDLSSFEKYII